MALSIGGAAFAQSTAPIGITPLKMNPKAANQALPLKDNQLGGPQDSFESMVSAIYPASHPHNRAFTFATIGTTSYQNQTNASICNRITKNADGTISATWTMSQVTNWSDRGTGYNYFDGTSWGAAPTVRLENVRTGFTNVGITAGGGEFVVAHEAPTSGTGLGTHITSRPVKGTGTWTDATIGATDTWPRLSIGGAARNTLHIIAQTSGATTPIVPYHQQDGAISYSRSTDGGLTWPVKRTLIPGLDSASYLGFGGDSYAMDTKGDTIVIVAGGFTVDVVMVKSIDNGTTWTKTVIKKFPIPFYNSATMITDTVGDVDTGTATTDADTLDTNDGSLAVLLDKTGMAHVWYGNMRVHCDNPGTAAPAGLSYFPGTNGIMYWNESMLTAPAVMIAGVIDLNSNGMIDVDFDNTGGGLLGYGSYNRCLTSFPTAGIDAAGKIYLAYSGIYEGVNDGGVVGGTGSANPSKSFRHEYVMRSDDNGATWCPPVDITDPTGGNYYEGVYGAMAKNVDGFIHIIVQQDNSPGHGVSTTATPDPQTGDADIIYYKIPVNDVACNVGIHENASSVSEVTLYPNPADNAVNLTLKVAKATKASIKIVNVVGQEVSHSESNLIAGNNIVTLDITKCKQGVYFVTAVIDGNNYTQKLIVK